MHGLIIRVINNVWVLCCVVLCCVVWVVAMLEVEHDSDQDELIAVSDPRKGGKPAGSYSVS
jgi:hypothetical protein